MFCPNDKITREQFAAFLYRFAVFEGRAQAGGGSDLAVFNDVSQVSGWAYPALQWAVVAEGYLRHAERLPAPPGQCHPRRSGDDPGPVYQPLPRGGMSA